MAYISKFTGAQIDDLLDKSKTMGAAVDELAQDVAAKEDAANKVTSITASADDTHYPSAKAVKTALTNLADGEDLASVGNVMKLADKTYAPTAYSGMGRKYLRKNLVSGKNILTQAMLPSANTIYIIQYDYDLNGATITIPENCTLDFQGGSLTNGTITFSNTELIGKVNINSKFNGSISNTKILISWFKAGERNNIDNYYEDTLKEVYSILKEGHLILDGYKYIVDGIALKSNTHLDLNGSEIKQKSETSDFPIIDGHNVSNISIINGTINGNKDNVSGNNTNGIRMINSNNYDIENINFVDVRRVCIVCWSRSYNFKIKNVKAVNCGLEDSLGNLIEAYQCSNFSIENSSFKEGFGVGTYIHACDNFSICNCEYSNISTDNGLTAESCKNFKVDNIKVENVKNVGVEINNCSHFQMNNIISGNNGSHNIFISTYTPSGEAPSCKGTLNNVKTYGAPEGYNGLKITSANDIQVNNSEIADNIFLTKTEFANEYIIFSNVRCPNATIYNSENILFLNCDIVHTGSNYEVFEYPQRENIQSNIIKEEKVIALNVEESYSITIPGTGNVATASGTLDILSFYNEAPNQNTKMIISFKMIGNTFEQSVISEQSSAIPRKLSITSRANKIIITNNQSIPLVVLLLLYGIYKP